MKKLLALTVLLCLFSTAADARGWAWFLQHIHPTGACPGGNEIIGSFYTSGHRTANGEVYHTNGISAAHRTLPFGTVLAVSNPRNGRSIQVRINDRGPYIHGVHPEGAIDLSNGARLALGMTASEYICINQGGWIDANGSPATRRHVLRSQSLLDRHIDSHGRIHRTAHHKAGMGRMTKAKQFGRPNTYHNAPQAIPVDNWNHGRLL